MIDGLIVFALRQRVFVLVLVTALIGFGLYSLSNLPIEAFPDVQDVQVQVIAQMSGQAPEDMERSVTLPIERELSGVPSLINVRSVTMSGLSLVTLTFAVPAIPLTVARTVAAPAATPVTMPDDDTVA